MIIFGNYDKIIKKKFIMSFYVLKSVKAKTIRGEKMYKIIHKKILNPTVTQMEIEAPLVANKAKPGQFIILRVNEDGERIPLTIAGCNKEFSTCCNKFNNAINFHGEPHLPGMNILLKVK